MKIRFHITPVVLLASCFFSLVVFASSDLPADGFGKNCGSATPLGHLAKGQSLMRQGVLQAATMEDWFSVSFSTGTALAITVQNAPAASDGGTDFQLEVIPSCGSPAIASAQGGPDLKQVTLGDSAPRTVILRVRAGNWKAAHATFKLVLSGQEPAPEKLMPGDRKPAQRVRP